MQRFDGKFKACDKAFYVYSVAVLPKYRRQGIGRFMRRQLIHWAKSAGYFVGLTHATADGIADDAARKVYRPTYSRRCPNFYGQNEDSIFMKFDIFK